jgi:predicted dienelactone hydrolase
MDPRGFLLYWERARDLSLVIDRLLADPKFGPRIDAKRIGAAGFSLGGFTVIEAAGGRFSQEAFDAFCRSPERDFTCEPQNEFPDAPSRFAALRESDPVTRESLRHSGDSFRDPRIRAIFVLAPALGGGFTKAGLAGITVPVEIVVGAADSVAPLETNAKRYAALIPQARLTVLPANVGHYTFLHECTPRGKQALPMCRDGEGVDRAAVHGEVARRALDFFRRALRSG